MGDRADHFALLLPGVADGEGIWRCTQTDGPRWFVTGVADTRGRDPVRGRELANPRHDSDTTCMAAAAPWNHCWVPCICQPLPVPVTVLALLRELPQFDVVELQEQPWFDFSTLAWALNKAGSMTLTRRFRRCGSGTTEDGCVFRQPLPHSPLFGGIGEAIWVKWEPRQRFRRPRRPILHLSGPAWNPGGSS